MDWNPPDDLLSNPDEQEKAIHKVKEELNYQLCNLAQIILPDDV